MVKSIGIATNLPWSFISSQKDGLKIINIITFLTLSRRNQRKPFYLVWARKRQRRNSRYPYQWQNNNSSSSQLSRFFSVHCWLDSLKKVLIFLSLDLALKPKLALKRIPQSSRGLSWRDEGDKTYLIAPEVSHVALLFFDPSNTSPDAGLWADDA